jgi:hypothetical protein
MNYSRVISSFLHFSKNDPVSEEQIQATQNTARNYLRPVFLLMEKPSLSFDFHRFAIPRPLGLLISNGLRRERLGHDVLWINSMRPVSNPRPVDRRISPIYKSRASLENAGET